MLVGVALSLFWRENGDGRGPNILGVFCGGTGE